MTSHPFFTAIPIAAAPQTNTLRDTAMAVFPLVVTSEADAAALDLTTEPATVNAIILNGQVFTYDSTDTTTAHDGVTCLVTSTGERFKADAVSPFPLSVDDKDTTAQPTSPAPTVGDAYLLPASPTGTDWSSKAKNIAIYTKRGWVFVPPAEGMLCYVSDEDSYYRYTNGGSWTEGLGGALSADDVRPKHSLFWGGVAVVNATTTTPPGSPATGVAYIVGSSATGAWSGQDGKLAVYNGAAWEFESPYTGATVYDVSNAYDLVWNSSAWVRKVPAGVLVGTDRAYTAGSIAISASAASADITSSQGTQVQALTYAATDAANEIEIIAECYPSASAGSGIQTMGLFKDTASGNSIFAAGATVGTTSHLPITLTWREVAGDTASHTWKLRLGTTSGTSGITAVLRSITVREYIPS